MRHHLDPQRARASMSMAPGPSPTRFEDADPEYEPPRVIGSGLPSMFQSVIRAAADADTHSLDSSVAIECAQRDPLLWDGDQA